MMGVIVTQMSMNRMISIFLLAFLTSQTVGAKSYFSEKKSLGAKTYLIKAYYEKNHDLLTIERKGETLLKESFPYLSQGFKTIQFHSPKGKDKDKALWLMAFFRKGVHGERVLVYDLKEEKILFNETSSWPSEIEKLDSGLKIKTFGDRIDQSDRYQESEKTLSF